jgi:hypothetical protein
MSERRITGVGGWSKKSEMLRADSEQGERNSERRTARQSSERLSHWAVADRGSSHVSEWMSRGLKQTRIAQIPGSHRDWSRPPRSRGSATALTKISGRRHCDRPRCSSHGSSASECQSDFPSRAFPVTALHHTPFRACLRREYEADGCSSR